MHSVQQNQGHPSFHRLCAEILPEFQQEAGVQLECHTNKRDQTCLLGIQKKERKKLGRLVMVWFISKTATA
jgi:hypothetical protein